MADSPVADEITTGSGIVSRSGRTLSSLSKEEYTEAMRILKTRNKPAVTSFQEEDGRIVDCIDFYKQSAFDNPLLKNQTIQVLSSSGKVPTSAEIASGFPSRSQFQEPADPSSYCTQSSPTATPLPSILVSKDNLIQSSTGGNGGQSNDVEVSGGPSDKSFELQEDPLS